MPKVLYIVGPTASGKTNLAVNIALNKGGEVICADSRTIYKGLDIGTAKPTAEEMRGVPHYGLDIIDPNETFSASAFYEKAKSWMEQILNQGKHVIVVGGTGLYIDSLFYDYSFTDMPDYQLRQKLENMSIPELQKIIEDKGYPMPENYKNKRYLIRTIERKGRVGTKKPAPKDALIIGIKPPKDVLIKRIEERAKKIRDDKILEECLWLFDNFGHDAPGASGNIYKSLYPYFTEQASLDDCFVNFIKLDCNLAKRQITWFKRNPNIIWFENADDAETYINKVL